MPSHSDFQVGRRRHHPPLPIAFKIQLLSAKRDAERVCEVLQLMHDVGGTLYLDMTGSLVERRYWALLDLQIYPQIYLFNVFSVLYICVSSSSALQCSVSSFHMEACKIISLPIPLFLELSNILEKDHISHFLTTLLHKGYCCSCCCLDCHQRELHRRKSHTSLCLANRLTSFVVPRCVL